VLELREDLEPFHLQADDGFTSNTIARAMRPPAFSIMIPLLRGSTRRTSVYIQDSYISIGRRRSHRLIVRKRTMARNHGW